MLAYLEPERGKENDEDEMEKAEIRFKFEENLRKQGLLLEHVNSTGKEACDTFSVAVLLRNILGFLDAE